MHTDKSEKWGKKIYTIKPQISLLDSDLSIPNQHACTYSFSCKQEISFLQS